MKPWQVLLTTLSFFMIKPVTAQRLYQLELDQPAESVARGQLDLGGSNPRGEAITVNNRYIERAGRPFFPVVGEFHYARYPAEQWEEAIRKMKAGGINVIATYVFWNIHERQEGTFDWTGNLNLRRFIEACARNEIFAMVRLGPFCHGEMRNGGLPDWLYGRAFEVRSNDPAYLAHVETLYGEIAAQMHGLLYKDGGPVIGVQLENEFQHSAAPWEIAYPGSAREYTVAERDLAVTHLQVSVSTVANAHAAYGADHMTNLKQIAQRHGIDVPLYTATGWGNAAIVPRGSIPVTAGYAYPFWAPPSPSPFYLFKDIRRQPDYVPVSYDPTLYPSIPAELGPGIMPTYSRRPRVPPESVVPLIVRTIGSGSNGIGYYMYHGGSTPVFGRFYSEEAGGLPKINYDFQAPIGEYGQLRPHYHSLKLLHMFLESYGATLAPMQTILPATNAAITPEDTTTLRYAVRTDGGSGFLFMQNFQDHVATTDLTDLRIALRGRGAPITFPADGTFTLPSGESAILPFQLELGGVVLHSATVQPLTVLQVGEVTHHVFFAIDGLPPELVFTGHHEIPGRNCGAQTADGLTIVRGPADETFAFTLSGQEFLVVPHALALAAWKIGAGQLWFADATVTAIAGGIEFVVPGRESVDVHVYPATATPARCAGGTITGVESPHGGMSAFTLNFVRREPPFAITPISRRKLVVTASGGLGDLHDVIMRVNYVGDRGMAFSNGQLVADHFYYGEPWEIGLRRFAAELTDGELVFVFHPVRREQTFLGDLDEAHQPAFAPGEDSLLSLGEISFIPEYRAVITVP